jgi:hypothetical protein
LKEIITFLDLKGNVVDPIIDQLSNSLERDCFSSSDSTLQVNFVSMTSNTNVITCEKSVGSFITPANISSNIDWIICALKTNFIAEAIVADFVNVVKEGMIIQVDNVIMNLDCKDIPEIYKLHIPDCSITTTAVTDSDETNIWLVWIKSDQHRLSLAHQITLF